jgi:hypothetical protein
MTFLAPWFLIGMLAAAIPLLLHLRRSRQSKPILFSCTRFFDEQFLKATRRARVQDLLMMMVRMALLALLALALAQPLLKSGPLAGLLSAGQARRVVIVFDDSASMANGMRFDQAKAHARAVIEELSPARGDAAALVLGGYREAGPTVLFDQPTTDLDAVRRAIDAVTLTDLATDLNGAIAAAGDLLSQATVGGEVIVISDLQATAFAPDHVVSPDPTVSMVFLACEGAADDANVSIDAVQLGAARPMIGVPFTFRTLLVNHDDRPRTTRVQLVVGEDVVATRSVELSPGRGQVVRFVHRFARAGWHGGRIELDPTLAPDAMPFDDRRHFAVHVEQRLHVLAINGAPSTIGHQDELYFVNAALAVGRTDERGVQVDVTTPDRVTEQQLAGYPVVIVANAPALAEPVRLAIERFVDGGGSAFITLGDRTDPAAVNRWAQFMPGRLGDITDEPTTVSTMDDAHPALAGLASTGGLRNVRIDRRFAIEPTDASVLMATPQGEALLLERRVGAGRVLLWTSTIDRDWNDLPLQPAYLPWLYRLLTHLAQPTLDRGLFALTGDSVLLPASIWNDAALQVKLPDGSTAYPAPSPTGGVMLSDTEQAGLYRVVRPGEGGTEPVLMFAANIDPEESRMALLGEADLAGAIVSQSTWAYVAPGRSLGEAGLRSARGTGLWDGLLIVALIVAIVEPWLANRLSQRRRRAALDPSVATPLKAAA